MNAITSLTRHCWMMVCFWAVQIAAFISVLLCVVLEIGPSSEWPTVVVLGTILAQCGLAAAFAVFGRWRLFFRMVCSATVVLGGVLAIEVADDLPSGLRGR